MIAAQNELRRRRGQAGAHEEAIEASVRGTSGAAWR